MKKIVLLLLVFTSLVRFAKAQHFDLISLPKYSSHVALTRLEVHRDSLFFFLESTVSAGTYYLGKFKSGPISRVALPLGMKPTRYEMASYGKKIYMVLRNASNDDHLYSWDGWAFNRITLPKNRIFSTFDEMEVYGKHLYVGLKNLSTSVIELFRFDGSTFSQVPLCDGCHIGMHPQTYENTKDEMIEYKGKLYIAGYLALDSSRWIYPESMLVYDGVSMDEVGEHWSQWTESYDQNFINENLLHTEGFYGYDGTTTVPITYYYPEVTGYDPVANPWVSPVGDALGKTVYNNAVYNSAYMPFYVPELDFLRRRFYSYSTNPDKAREIFLPEGYQFGGVETFYSHLKVYKCRLYMFIIHDSGVHKLASFRESFVTACELPYPLPYPYPYEFTLYPNPGDGLFNVSIPDGVIGPFVVKVFNNVGKLVLDTTLDEQSKAIDLRVFGKGLFTVQINNSKPIRVAIK